MLRTLGCLSLCGAAALVSTSANAQAFGEPLYGSHSLQAGFMPDPVTQQLQTELLEFLQASGR